MRYLYTTLLYFATPWILLRLFLRSRKNREYRLRIKERFALIPLIKNKKSIWVHAVSLGELIAATPLIRGLIQQYPNHTIVVTTTTPTGSQELQKRFGNQVYHVYTPYDLPPILRRFIKRTRPEKAIIMETELWPNLLFELNRAGIPLTIANARLSERSFSHYRYLQFFFKPLLKKVNLIATQSSADAERFKKLGAPHVVTIGNIKFDLDIPHDLIEQAQRLKINWKNRPHLIAASTHEGEEIIILNAFKKVLQKFPNALLTLVPRHPERFDKIYKLLLENEFTVARRSCDELPGASHQVYLGDTMGELKLLYAASDIAFVGGSFAPIGGHNLIEPASLSLPVISGPNLDNFIAIRNLLQEAGGLIIVDNSDELADQVTRLFADKDKSDLFGARALSVIDQNRGAIQKHLSLIAELG